MKDVRLFLKIILLYSSSIAIVAATPLPAPSSHVRQLLNHMRSFEAHFEQRLLDERGRVLERQAGHLFLKKPGRLYWEVKGREPRIIISNGKKVWDFDPILEQVIIQTVKRNADLTPIVFLSHDLGSLIKEFSVSEVSVKAPKKCLTKSEQCFILQPKRREQGVEKVELGFKAGILQEFRLLDPLGRYTQVVFKQIHFNQPIADLKFQFQMPENVDILTN